MLNGCAGRPWKGLLPKAGRGAIRVVTGLISGHRITPGNPPKRPCCPSTGPSAPPVRFRRARRESRRKRALAIPPARSPPGSDAPPPDAPLTPNMPPPPFLRPTSSERPERWSPEFPRWISAVSADGPHWRRPSPWRTPSARRSPRRKRPRPTADSAPLPLPRRLPGRAPRQSPVAARATRMLVAIGNRRMPPARARHTRAAAGPPVAGRHCAYSSREAYTTSTSAGRSDAREKFDNRIIAGPNQTAVAAVRKTSGTMSVLSSIGTMAYSAKETAALHAQASRVYPSTCASSESSVC
jgi:hypothetical protein